MIDMIPSPVGDILVGQLVQFSEYDITGMRTGMYPQTTQVPTFIRYRDYIPRLEATRDGMWNIWEQWSYQSFSSMDDVISALETPQFHPLVTDIVWLFGAPDVGGLGLIKTSSGNYSVVYIDGYSMSGDVIVPNCNSLTITAAPSITIQNPFVGGAENIPKSGTYDTGLTFYAIYDYDSNLKNATWDGNLHFNAMSIFPNAQEAILIEQGGATVKSTITFTDVGENLDVSWRHKFYNTFPEGNPITDPVWADLKTYQWSIRERYPYWGLIGINSVEWIEGTSIFGGESATIDENGNPYEIYDPFGVGSVGGGGPQSRYSEDTLPEGVPDITLLNSGFVKLYNPTLSEVQNFASFLFSGITEDMSAVFKRMLVNPLDYILALNMIHIPLVTSSFEDIGFCGVSSGVSSKVVTKQYYEIEYQIDVHEFWKTALDYSSYTKIKMYIPYCTIADLNIDEIQEGTLWLRYVVDVVSGSLVAFVGTKRKQKDGTLLRATLYQYNGNCILPMPVSQTNWQNTFASVLNIASAAIAPTPTTFAGMAKDIMSQKVSVQKSGSISANFGYLGKQTPYIILERPELSLPVDYGKHFGYPSNRLVYLGGCKGFTAIDTEQGFIADDIPNITPEEAEELKSLLASGVYFPN